MANSEVGTLSRSGAANDRLDWPGPFVSAVAVQ